MQKTGELGCKQGIHLKAVKRVVKALHPIFCFGRAPEDWPSISAGTLKGAERIDEHVQPESQQMGEGGKEQVDQLAQDHRA